MDESPANVGCRHEYALLLRRFMAGRMTTDSYESAYCRIASTHEPDAAAQSIFDVAWHLYSDLLPHRMTGRHRPDRETRRLVARCILFLRSQEPLEPAPLYHSPPETDPPTASLNLWHFFGGVTRVVALMVSLLAGSLLGILSSLIAPARWFGHICAISDIEPPPAAFAVGRNNRWPFRSAAELLAAASVPTYLHGGSTAPISR